MARQPSRPGVASLSARPILDVHCVHLVHALPTVSAQEDGVDEVPIRDARKEFADVLNRVAYRQERVVLTRRGKALAAVVPMEDVELLERLEDQADLEAIRAALADPANAEPVPWERVKADLGL
jgi:prevent-host-death family protein